LGPVYEIVMAAMFLASSTASLMSGTGHSSMTVA
jgi:hypothetical protein